MYTLYMYIYMYLDISTDFKDVESSEGRGGKIGSCCHVSDVLDISVGVDVYLQ